MPFIRRLGFIFLALFATAASAQATIDTSVYFAYAKLSPNGMETVYVLLSNKPCQDEQASKKGWKMAEYNYPRIASTAPGCWQQYPKNEYGTDMRICRVGEESGQLGNACLPASKSRFNSTASLPRQANF